jgi:hypothetical protein
LLVALSIALVIPPSVLQFAFELHALLVDVMEEERSPILDIVGDVSKVPLPEVLTYSSSSDASSGGAASDEAKAKVEDTVVVDPREFEWSYDFETSFVTVGCIWQLESLRYLVTHEPGKETVLEPNDDEAVVFKEFFTAGLPMPPHSVFTEILLKYRVQLHQLTPNVVTQVSKFFWAVLSFGGEPSSVGFANRYELYYHLNKVVVDGFEKL